MNFDRWRGALGIATLVTPALACGGSASSRDGRTADEGDIGVVVAELTNIPLDVQCVEINTSSYRVGTVRTDVRPGGSASIRLAPIDPGFVSISGNAYDVPCWQLGYGYPGYPGYPTYPAYSEGRDASPLEDAGTPGTPLTWVADPIWVSVSAGQTSTANLRFHQLGAVDVTVDFDNCPSNVDWGYPVDAAVMASDGGSGAFIPPTSCPPPPSFDGGVVDDGGPGPAEDGGGPWMDAVAPEDAGTALRE